MTTRQDFWYSSDTEVAEIIANMNKGLDKAKMTQAGIKWGTIVLTDWARKLFVRWWIVEKLCEFYWLKKWEINNMQAWKRCNVSEKDRARLIAICEQQQFILKNEDWTYDLWDQWSNPLIWELEASVRREQAKDERIAELENELMKKHSVDPESLPDPAFDKEAINTTAVNTTVDLEITQSNNGWSGTPEEIEWTDAAAVEWEWAANTWNQWETPTNPTDEESEKESLTVSDSGWDTKSD